MSDWERSADMSMRIFHDIGLGTPDMFTIWCLTKRRCEPLIRWTHFAIRAFPYSALAYSLPTSTSEIGYGHLVSPL